MASASGLPPARAESTSASLPESHGRTTIPAISTAFRQQGRIPPHTNRETPWRDRTSMSGAEPPSGTGRTVRSAGTPPDMRTQRSSAAVSSSVARRSS
ncbi:hypothetical protein [Nitratidesulfovibrio sp. 1201_IL3209]|uniref:hypothetical protein n=1 Tax=Nitratidesulfovibrio sp. 1201_IL3209 TaxID=3084053 RepID=UPI002FDADAB9